jgi:hypothetical protein
MKRKSGEDASAGDVGGGEMGIKLIIIFDRNGKR